MLSMNTMRQDIRLRDALHACSQVNSFGKHQLMLLGNTSGLLLMKMAHIWQCSCFADCEETPVLKYGKGGCNAIQEIVCEAVNMAALESYKKALKENPKAMMAFSVIRAHHDSAHAQ